MKRPRARRVACRAMPDDKIFYDADADPDALAGKTIAILGYGSQGHAHALNLKESGDDVVVGLRADSSSRAKAEAAGLEVLDIADAASRGDMVMVLLPDEKQAEVWEAEIADGIAAGDLLHVRATGSRSTSARSSRPPGVDVGMVAPKGPGHLVRRQYEEGKGVPCLMASHQDETGNAQRARARLRQRDRRRPRRGHRDHLQGRVRDRPLRRADGALRRRDRARPRRVRDPGRGRLRPAPRLLRDPARAEADRRPDVREGRPGHALLDLEHGRVRRHDPRAAGDRPRGARGDEADPRRHPVGRVRQASGSPRTEPGRRTSPHARGEPPATRSRPWARTCAR